MLIALIRNITKKITFVIIVEAISVDIIYG